jgi:hypothetical protein
MPEEEIREAEVELIRATPSRPIVLESMDHQGLIGTTVVVPSSLTTRTPAKIQIASGGK